MFNFQHKCLSLCLDIMTTEGNFNDCPGWKTDAQDRTSVSTLLTPLTANIVCCYDSDDVSHDFVILYAIFLIWNCSFIPSVCMFTVVFKHFFLSPFYVVLVSGDLTAFCSWTLFSIQSLIRDEVNSFCTSSLTKPLYVCVWGWRFNELQFKHFACFYCDITARGKTARAQDCSEPPGQIWTVWISFCPIFLPDSEVFDVSAQRGGTLSECSSW